MIQEQERIILLKPSEIDEGESLNSSVHITKWNGCSFRL